MRWFRQSPVGVVGDLLFLLPLLARLLEWVLELRIVRVGLGMANLGQAVDFIIQHLENPGWMGNGWVQFTAIVIGLLLVFWDHKRPSWLPSPELSSSQMVIGGLVVILIGTVIVAVGVWRQPSGEIVAVEGTTKPSVQPHPQQQPAQQPTSFPGQHPYLKADAEVLVPALRQMHDILYESVRDSTSLESYFKMRTGILTPRLISLDPKIGLEAIQNVQTFYSDLQNKMQSVMRKNLSYGDDLQPIVATVYPPQEFMDVMKDYSDILTLLAQGSKSIGDAQSLATSYNKKIAQGIEQQYQIRVDALRKVEAKIAKIRESIE